MINACELHEKILMEKILANAHMLAKKKENAERFVKEVIEPYLNKVTEMPNHDFLGYMWDGNLYHRLSGEIVNRTAQGYIKYEREFIDCKFSGYASEFDISVVNEILASYGFTISVEIKPMVMCRYTSSSSKRYVDVNIIYLDTLCPFA